MINLKVKPNNDTIAFRIFLYEIILYDSIKFKFVQGGSTKILKTFVQRHHHSLFSTDEIENSSSSLCRASGSGFTEEDGCVGEGKAWLHMTNK